MSRNKVLIVGDFNARHGYSNNYTGNCLLNMSDKFNFQILTPDEPTFYPDNILLHLNITDLVLGKNITTASQLVSLHLLNF